jgi:hypothetical protein
MQRDILKWGKAPQLCFQDEKEFYRTLGQLTNELAFTISFEPNSKTGSYSDAYRIRALYKEANGVKMLFTDDETKKAYEKFINDLNDFYNYDI